MIAHRNHSANTMLAIDGPKSQRRDTHRPFLAERLCGRDARRCGRGSRRTVTGQNQRSCPDLDYDVGEAENTGTAHQAQVMSGMAASYSGDAHSLSHIRSGISVHA